MFAVIAVAVVAFFGGAAFVAYQSDKSKQDKWREDLRKGGKA